MPAKIPQRDPRSAHRRQSTASRRAANKRCSCGESRPKALIPKSNPTICAKCQRIRQGRTTVDRHHPPGIANDPLRIPVPVNDHRAELSVAQDDWPKDVLENPDGCPLIRAAACVLGFVDTAICLIKSLLLWIAEMLRALSLFLVAKLGPKWWVGTPLEKFAPRRKK